MGAAEVLERKIRSGEYRSGQWLPSERAMADEFRVSRIIIREAVKAIVVPKPGRTPDPLDIIAFARTRIAAFKVPKSVDFIEALPRNSSGKILRRELREPYWAGHARRVN